MNLCRPTSIKNVLEKYEFVLKTDRSDGLILQIHHTTLKNGISNQLRFILATFSVHDEKLAACDCKGNIFIIDFITEKYWILPKMGQCTVLEFSEFETNTLAVGIDNGPVLFVNVESLYQIEKLIGHTKSVKQISFSENRLCLTASSSEAIIWNLNTYTQVHQLSFQQQTEIKFAMFVPVSNNIFACFQDDIMHVWKCNTFEPLKQLLPATWKGRHLRSVAFTRNGRAMILGGLSESLVVFSVDMWSLDKVLNLPDNITGIRHLEFVSQVFDGGANKTLAILSSDCKLYLYDIEQNIFKFKFDCGQSISSFRCSANGKYIACILQTGEINIYLMTTLLINSTPKRKTEKLSTKRSVKIERLPTKRSVVQRQTSINVEANRILNKERLQKILKEYNEYPQRYRILIWKTILKLPLNEESYVGLASRGQHIQFKNLNEKYPLENKTELKNLQKLLSCLAHWCPLFGQLTSIPLFVFPFVKMIQNDPLVCFEIVCTIIVNWCQFWFEYFPFPPLNILAIIENVLSVHDSQLFDHFSLHGITSQTYAWTLLETAFSEVLSKEEWLQLWDHVISNEPAFLLLAAIAYNIMFRNSLLSCQTPEQFNYFYHNQNPINMNTFISKIYSFCRSTESHIHPRNYLKSFKPLEKSSYPIYNQYPKNIVDKHAEKVKSIQKDEEKMLEDEMEVAKLQILQQKRLKDRLKHEVEEARLHKLQKVYENALKEEEERLAEHRQKVLSLHKDLKDREIEFLKVNKERLRRQNTLQCSAKIEKKLDEFVNTRKYQEDEISAIKNALQTQRLDFLKFKYSDPIKHFKQGTLSEENNGMFSFPCRHLNIANRVAVLDDLLQKLETEVVKDLSSHQVQPFIEQSPLVELEEETKQLESDCEKLLKKLTSAQMAKLRANKNVQNKTKHTLKKGKWNENIDKGAGGTGEFLTVRRPSNQVSNSIYLRNDEH